MKTERISSDDVRKILEELGPMSSSYHESVIVRMGHDLIDAREEMKKTSPRYPVDIIDPAKGWNP